MLLEVSISEDPPSSEESSSWTKVEIFHSFRAKIKGQHGLSKNTVLDDGFSEKNIFFAPLAHSGSQINQ